MTVPVSPDSSDSSDSSRQWTSGPRIYNLFPLLAGLLSSWEPHLERAQRLGFNWVYMNPFHAPGYSGSLYAIKDYYTVDPRLLDPNQGEEDQAAQPEVQLKRMLRTAQRLGLKVMMDLVINHTAFDSVLVSQHPDWYKYDVDGKHVHPSAKDGNTKIVWGDLVEIDNADSPDREQLWQYWLALLEHYATLGFDGFRCDAAYKVPTELWQFLIPGLKQTYPDRLFVAESLGCPIEETVGLAQAGFDYLFNSSKWWDLTGRWCLNDYRQTAPWAPSISFPESHDTERLATELHGDQAAVKQRYAFAGLYSSGVLMPMGFEYGIRRRLDVVKTRPQDWEELVWDLSDFITTVNHIKMTHRVFNEDGPIKLVRVQNQHVFACVKSSVDGAERALILLNKDRDYPQRCSLERMAHFFAPPGQIQDLALDGRLHHTTNFRTCRLKPSGVAVLYYKKRWGPKGPITTS